MRASQNSKHRPNIFVSAKAATAIPVAHQLVSDALVQAALDPEVRAIEFIPTVSACGTVIPLDAIVFRTADGRQLLDIPEARPLRTLDDEGLALLAVDQLGLPALRLTAANIRQQPRAANASMVWNSRYLRIQASDRVRVMQALNEDGPMPLIRLSAEVRWSIDPVAAVLSMACLDLIELDLTSIALGPETVVRRRVAEGEAR